MAEPWGEPPQVLPPPPSEGLLPPLQLSTFDFHVSVNESTSVTVVLSAVNVTYGALFSKVTVTDPLADKGPELQTTA